MLRSTKLMNQSARNVSTDMIHGSVQSQRPTLLLSRLRVKERMLVIDSILDNTFSNDRATPTPHRPVTKKRNERWPCIHMECMVLLGVLGTTQTTSSKQQRQGQRGFERDGVLFSLIRGLPLERRLQRILYSVGIT